MYWACATSAQQFRRPCRLVLCFITVKLGFKELLNKEQIGFKELFTDYRLFYIINLLLNKELLPIYEMPKLGISEHKIVKISKKVTL